MSDDKRTLDELIRDAYRASEGVDNWDRGRTFYPSDVFHSPPRECSFEEVVREQSEADQRLITYVKENL